MTVEQLNSYNVKDLAQLAKQHGVAGWHSMRKAQLVDALAEATSPKKSKSRSRNGGSTTKHGGSAPSSASSGNRVAGKASSGGNRHGSAAKEGKRTAKRAEMLDQIKDNMERKKNLAYRPANGKPGEVARDRLIVMVRDPYWLHAYWELTRLGVQRAEAALAQEWHTAKPVLRLFEINNHGSTNASETLVRTINIHGGVNNWYIDVQDPPKTYRVDIGYLAGSGKFYSLSRSNIVNTPRPGTQGSLDENWSDVADQCDKIYALSGGYAADQDTSDLKELFEERLRRPMSTPLPRNVGLAVNGGKPREFTFSLDAELILSGATEPDARVTLQGDPVQLRPDGTFTVRFNMPDIRQIIPAVASSADGLEQRTIVVAVERNTKVMEPISKEHDDA